MPLRVSLTLIWALAYAVATAYSGIVMGLFITSAVVIGAISFADKAAWKRWLLVEPRGVLLGLGVGAVTAAATHLLLPVLTAWVPLVARDVAHMRATSGASWALLPAVAVIGLTEELLWRGLWLDGDGPRARRVLVAAGVYALAQAGCLAPSIVGVALSLGILWGAMRVLTKSLVPSMIAHLMWTLTMVYGPFLTSS